MESPELIRFQRKPPGLDARRREGAPALSDTTPSFHERFVDLFEGHFKKLHRYLNRVSGEPDLAADLAQEAFIKLYRRGSLPDAPEAWLITVAMNLFRNEKTTRSRRLRLLGPAHGETTHADPAPSFERLAEAGASRRRVRYALDHLADRERRLLLLRAEGYRYRDIAAALELNEASIGVLLARARRSFRKHYEGTSDAS